MKTRAISSSAIFSECKKYRYVLERKFHVGDKIVNFILLNPSTADELNNDPTIAKCEKWAIDNGYSKMYITNVFSYRATDPKRMIDSNEPIGKYNNSYICDISEISNTIVCGWGNYGIINSRNNEVLKLLKGKKLNCFRINKNGSPSHPLYIPIVELTEYNGIS